jgi:hypothetical protein
MSLGVRSVPLDKRKTRADSEADASRCVSIQERKTCRGIFLFDSVAVSSTARSGLFKSGSCGTALYLQPFAQDYELGQRTSSLIGAEISTVADVASKP